MSPRLQTRLLAVLLSATVLMGTPVAAHAERVVTQDAVGDAVEVTFDGEEEQFAPAPDAPAVDVTRTVVDHRGHRMRVSVHVQDLTATPWHVTVIRVRTPDRRFSIEVERTRSRPRGVATLSGRGPHIACPGLRWSFDRDRDRVTASVPTTCIGTPRWVRIGAGAVSINEPTGDPTSASAFADDGNRPGLVSEGDLRLGPKVRRG